MLVSAACDLAAAEGVRAGMKLAQAQAMLPGLRTRQATPDADDAALSALAGWCRRYTPLTCAAPPDGIWLDLSGCAALFGGEPALLSDLAERLDRAGLSARIAVAGTMGAAFALARHGRGDSTHAPLSLPDHRLAEALAPLPIAALRLEPEQEALLHRFGLRQVGALESLPRGPLARRLGAQVLLRLDQAHGRVAEPVCPDLPPVALQDRLAFPEPLQTADSLAAANALLSARLCARLQALCLGARLLELSFVRLDGSVQTQSVALSRPSHDARHVGRLLDERLDQVDPGEGVEAIWLLARIAEPAGAAQAGLGMPAQDGTPDRMTEPGQDGLAALAPLIDTLRTRLGDRKLWRPACIESDVPERSVSRRPPLSPAVGRWPASLPRPVRLIEPPAPVRALAGLPDHPPAWFIWRRQRHVVRRADGPERIAGEWWLRRGEMTAIRDYFRVEDAQGRRFWLFRRGDGVDPGTGDLGWFLHGLF